MIAKLSKRGDEPAFGKKNPVSHLRAFGVGAACALLIIAGCSAPSLLITPVSSNRSLQETVLSRDSFFAMSKIAMIDVSGEIANSRRALLFGTGENPVSLLVEQLDKARSDRSVKAVVLRINSPGGSVVASEIMHDEIMRFRKTGRPVVAVMMDVAASGGYYIACACDEIIAHPSTVTGSIGVIMQMVDVTGTMNMIGVKTDAITSGPFKDAGSPLRAMKPNERELFQHMVDDMYDRFIEAVVAGRSSLDEAHVRKLADGRVYTARQALEAGLIDRIGSVHDAIECAKQRAGVKQVRIVTYHRPAEYKPNYYAQAPNTPTGDVNLIKIDPSALLGLTTPRFLYLWRPAMGAAR